MQKESWFGWQVKFFWLLRNYIRVELWISLKLQNFIYAITQIHLEEIVLKIVLRSKLAMIGFDEGVHGTIDKFHRQRQTVLFSATMPQRCGNLMSTKCTNISKVWRWCYWSGIHGGKRRTRRVQWSDSIVQRREKKCSNCHWHLLRNFPDNIQHVINFDMPTEIENYMLRLQQW